ncbi:hypothetical protein BGX38DRAFT_1189217 [Terfezia claveryi]|nr:hypothetical protein BGX38DRAFT_1189217 [Terfezia claveryi]
MFLISSLRLGIVLVIRTRTSLILLLLTLPHRWTPPATKYLRSLFCQPSHSNSFSVHFLFTSSAIVTAFPPPHHNTP